MKRHSFEIPMHRHQSDAVQVAWGEHGEPRGCVICQPRWELGVFRCAILPAEDAERLESFLVLITAKKEVSA